MVGYVVWFKDLTNIFKLIIVKLIKCVTDFVAI